jgi:signal transduction histidine kinase
MQNSPLFHRTRLKLASAYAGAMGCILGLCGFWLYQVVTHDYRESIDQGLESVTWAIGEAIEPYLDHNGSWRRIANQFSLTLCSPGQACRIQSSDMDALVKAASPIDYYLRILNEDNQLIALGGINPEMVPLTLGEEYWQTVTSTSERRFRQISMPLDHDGHRWGYLQVGRSLVDFDRHLHSLRLALLLGLPLVIALVACSSWWLAGLAMRPIYASYLQMQQFTSDAAHEFRTPLTAMQSTIEAVQQTHLNQDYAPNHPLAEVARVLDVLHRQGMRLSQLVNDLLLLAKIERQEPAADTQPCHLNEILNDLIEELAVLAVQAEVALRVRTPKTASADESFGENFLPLTVSGNEAQLYRLFSNLIVNAIQATPPGGKVTVQLSQIEQKAVVKVIDTGIGIDPKDQSHIFDRFYRVQPDRSRHKGGSGLGLAIAQAIVVAHHGTLHAQSTPAQGSQFIVRLPLA